MENINKLNKKCFITKILISPKLPNPIRKTPVLKLVFITIPYLNFWAQTTLLPCWFASCNFSTYVHLHSRSEKCQKFVCITVILPGYITDCVDSGRFGQYDCFFGQLKQFGFNFLIFQCSEFVIH